MHPSLTFVITSLPAAAPPEAAAKTIALIGSVIILLSLAIAAGYFGEPPRSIPRSSNMRFDR